MLIYSERKAPRKGQGCGVGDFSGLGVERTWEFDSLTILGTRSWELNEKSTSLHPWKG